MSEKRALRWVIVFAAACALYFASVAVTGAWTRNGAWLLVVIVAVAYLIAWLLGARRGKR